MVFDLTAVASRLEALQHSSGEDGPKGGEGRRGFLAQIRPDSNAAAEEELRREIRWEVRTKKTYTRSCISLLHTCSKEMFAKMEVIGQVC